MPVVHGIVHSQASLHGCLRSCRAAGHSQGHSAWGWFSCACSLHASDASAAGHEPGQAWDWVSHLGGGRGHSLVGALHEGGGGMMHHSPAPPEGRGCLSVGRCLETQGDSTMKAIAVWILRVLVPSPAAMEKQKRWANTAAWWIFVNGERPIGAANRHESSNI